MGNEKIIEEVKKIARAYFSGKEYSPKIEGKAGVFVTLKKGSELRGCIGVIHQIPLKEGLIEATIGALNDPRFKPVNEEEFSKLKIEVTLLGPLEQVKNIKEIEIGKDGVMISYGIYNGLLLPQVATEYGWDVETFLDHCCIKAGLFKGCWTSDKVKIYKFKGIVIEERG